MMDRADIEEYIVKNGVPVTRPVYADGQKLRVMDLTVLPGVIREHFDERGFLKVAETPKDESTQEPQPKKGKKK